MNEARVEITLKEDGSLDTVMQANVTEGFAMAAVLVMALVKKSGVTPETALDIIRKGVNELNET